MDYVEGTDAAKLLRSQYPSGMPKADVVEIISAVADALDHAHSRGMLHRDVKPANILLGSISQARPRRRILLADFGIARQMGEISDLTATNMLVGTTAYCAPEQLRGNDLDARADQYALGCTAFNLLTGCAPFEHSNPAVVISQHLSEAPPLVSERRPELAQLDAVIAKAMAKNPNERYATCADFASALAGQAVTAPDDVAGPTEIIAAPEQTSERSEKARSWRGPATVAAALVTVALVAVAAVIGVRMLGARTTQQNDSAPSASGTAPTSAHAAPPSGPAIRLTSQITDQSGVLTPVGYAAVDTAVTKLYNGRGTRLWVVYVKNFGGLKPFRWAEDTMRANGFAESDAILAVATDQPSFSFRVPDAVIQGKAIDLEIIRRDRIGPAVFHREWARAAIAAANGLDIAPS
jgi:serine/threonine-protein kinase